MQRPKKEIPHDRVIVNAARKAALEALSPEDRAARAERKAAIEEKSKRKKTARHQRQRAILERLLDSCTQAEIARALNTGEDRVSEAIREIWPFAPCNRDSRYMLVSLSLAELAAAEALSRDLHLPRRRAVEEVLSAVLESGGHVARRILKVKADAEAQS